MIGIDWYAEFINYGNGVRSVSIVGKRVADLIGTLYNNSIINIADVTIIGHSLGAQIAAFGML